LTRLAGSRNNKIDKALIDQIIVFGVVLSKILGKSVMYNLLWPYFISASKQPVKMHCACLHFLQMVSNVPIASSMLYWIVYE